jgi:hypothetical protein
MEDALRRAIVQVGDVSSIVVQIELSLRRSAPRRCRRRHPAGVGTISGRAFDRYGLPSAARCERWIAKGPLATLVIAYRT